MDDLRKYVLYSAEQVSAFRERFAGLIDANRFSYMKWLRSLPLMEWVDYLAHVGPRDYEVVIGLICICYQEGFVSVTFSPDYRRIRRDPHTDEELKDAFGVRL